MCQIIEFSAKYQQVAIKLVIASCDFTIDEVYSDKDRIKQILMNLASNALKYTQKGTLTFRLRYMMKCIKRDDQDQPFNSQGNKEREFITKKFAVIEVQDTGKGISKQGQ